MKSGTGGMTVLLDPPYSVLPANEPWPAVNSSELVPVQRAHRTRELLWPNQFGVKPELTWSRSVDGPRGWLCQLF